MGQFGISEAFGVVIREHRHRLKLSQEALAEKAGIHPTHVGLIERAERNTTLRVAQSLARALGTSLAALIQQAERLETDGLKPGG